VCIDQSGMAGIVRKAGRRGNLYSTKTQPDQRIDAAVAHDGDWLSDDR
jgi:hypothetical protein